MLKNMNCIIIIIIIIIITLEGIKKIKNGKKMVTKESEQLREHAERGKYIIRLQNIYFTPWNASPCPTKWWQEGRTPDVQNRQNRT